MGWNEAELLRWLGRRAPASVLAGSAGHDAAVLKRFAGHPVVCCDQVVEGVHARTGCGGEKLGRKAAGRALSDLAATAAQPVALLLAIAAPLEETGRRLRAVIEGVHGKALEYGAELVGGDLTSTCGPLSLNVTALGRYEGRRRAPGRDRARPGDWIVVTGPLGGSGLGRHLDPCPRFEVGTFLVRHGARALMDVSDGLAIDLARLAKASGVRIDLESVPVHADALRAARRSGRSARAHALHDGEDHELLASLAPRGWKAASVVGLQRFPALQVIGRVRAGRGLWLAADGEKTGGQPELRPWDGRGGWVHGA